MELTERLSQVVYVIRFVFKAGWSPTPCIAEGDLELPVLFPLPPSCWNYGCASPHPFYVVLVIETRTSALLGKHSAPELHPQALIHVFE